MPDKEPDARVSPDLSTFTPERARAALDRAWGLVHDDAEVPTRLIFKEDLLLVCIMASLFTGDIRR